MTAVIFIYHDSFCKIRKPFRYYKYVLLTDLEFPDGFQRYKIAYTNTFGKPPWFDAVAQEYAACREAIGLSDYSSFTKIDLWVII